MKRLRSIDRNWPILVAVLGCLALLPLLLKSPSQREIAVQLLIFATIGVAWNILGGITGQLSFGHGLFFGAGAYTSAVLVIDHGMSPWLGMLCAATVAALAGLLISTLCFRYGLKGAYFALATFAFAEMARLIVLGSEMLNTGIGYRLEFSDPGFLSLQFPSGSSSYYYIALGLLTIALVVTIVLLRNRTGQYLVAIREDEEAARAVGINPSRYKTVAVLISAAITGAVGAFYLQFFFFIEPNLAFGSTVSIEAVLPAVIGGLGTIWGPLVGAIAVTGLTELTSELTRNPPGFLAFVEGRSGLDVMVFGAALIVIILFLPKGLYGTVAERWKR